MSRIIEVIVSPTGQTTIQTKGYQGSQCTQASKWLEKALGEVTSDKKTPEYFDTQSQVQELEH